MAASGVGGSGAPAGQPAPRPHQLRPDIQGLRAIAVLTVIASHAGITRLEGGFVGVDVFFVISGFLISHLLYREVRRDGRISLSGFYARRARRILPAATVVTLATLAAASALLSLVDARAVVDDAVWAAFFAANIRFAITGVDYFAQGQAPSPLQHYWSLSVEEQFYLVWPLLLLGVVTAAAALARRRASGGHAPDRTAGDPLPVRGLVATLAVVCAASLAWSLFATSTSPATAYFSTLARAWELGVGALAALGGPALARRLSGAARSVLAAGGLAAIALACVMFTETTPFPGYAALLPVLGSAAVLLAGIDLPGDRPPPLPVRALGVPPMRVVGDWSYSLYLWHWPVLIVLDSRAGDPAPLTVAAAVALVFVLSALTYRYVETPFRSGARLTVPRSLVLYPVSLALVAGAATGSWYYVRWAGGELGDDPAITVEGVREEVSGVDFAEEQAVALVQASVLAARRGDTRPSDLSPDLLSLRDDIAPIGDCDYGKGSRDLCPGGDPDGEKTLVVLGDSHGRAWIPAFEEIAERAGYRTYHLVKVQCTAADVTVAKLGSGEAWEDCTDFHEWTYQQLEEIQPDLVVVSTSPPVNGVYVDGTRRLGTEPVADEMRAGYDRLFERVAPTTDRLVLLRDVPKAPEDPAVCLTEGDDQLGRCMFRPVERAELLAQQSVDAARAAGLQVVNPRKWLCWQGQCPAVVGSTLTYRDPGHITATYAEELALPLGRALGLLPADAQAVDPD